MEKILKEKIVNKLSNRYSENEISDYIQNNYSFFDKLLSIELQQVIIFSIVCFSYILWIVSISNNLIWLKETSIIFFIFALLYSVFPKKFLKGFMFYICFALSLANIYLSSLLTGDSLIALIITGALLAMKITNK